MPKGISEEGMVFAARERVVLRNNTDKVLINPSDENSRYHGEEVQPGEEYIYEGPDRGFQELLKEMGAENEGYLGQPFEQNPEMIQLARQKHYTSVKEMVEMEGYDKELTKKRVEEAKKKVNSHKLPEKKPGQKFSGGGRNTTGGGNEIQGDWGDLPKI